MRQTKKLGCLLIHGFTSNRDSLEAIIPELDKRSISWQYPILTGHGTKPQDLEHATWEIWQQDVETAFKKLLNKCEKVIIIGLSMGSLLALELAAKYQVQVSGLILLSPALHFTLSITKYTPELSKYIKRFPEINLLRFSDPRIALKHKHYYWFPSAPFLHYWQRTQNFDAVLKNVSQPTLIIHSKKDKIAAASGAEYIYKTISSPDKKIIWLKKSGHELLLDVEAKTTLKQIFLFQHLQ